MNSSSDSLSRPRLSVAMIVRNEEDVLAETLESVRTIADEIVITDTGSTDATVAVARRYGALVDQIPWPQDFSAARNHCLARTSGDFILLLDAGERLNAESAAELRQFIDSQAEPNKTYFVMVEVPPADPAASSEQAARVRLIPRNAALRFSGRTRETLAPSIEAAGLQLDAGPGRIVGHARLHDSSRKTLCAQRDLELVALETAGNPRPPARFMLAKGDACSNLGAYADARQAFLKALETAEHGSTEMLEAYYGLLTTYENDPFLQDMQLNICLEALEVFPLDAQLLLAMGSHLQDRGRCDLAIRSFETAVKHGQVDMETWHLTEISEMSATCLALALQIQQRNDEALSVLQEAGVRSPNSMRLRRQLLDLYIKLERTDEALALAGEFPTAEGEVREALPLAVRGACHAAKKEWAAALGCLQGAYVAGCQSPLCLRWLAVTLLSNGQTEAARPVLEDWLAIEPTNVELQTYLALLEGRHGSTGETDATEAEDASTQYLRIDRAVTSLAASPSILPIISQSNSIDSVAQ